MGIDRSLTRKEAVAIVWSSNGEPNKGILLLKTRWVYERCLKGK